MVRRSTLVLGTIVLCSARLCLACDTSTLNLVSDPQDAAVVDATPPDASAAPVLCDGQPCACNDGIDNDLDGLIDGFDSECSGPFDDDEGSFGVGEPAAPDTCRACFFSPADGASAIECVVAQECVLNDAALPMPGEFQCTQGCAVPMACTDTCRPVTPNGCDCFGCCTIERSTLPKLNVLLTDRCSLTTLDDESACPRCTPNDGCRNPCGRCELCPGRSRAQLPMDCSRELLGHRCDDREPACDGDHPCDDGAYCHFGCCLRVTPMPPPPRP